MRFPAFVVAAHISATLSAQTWDLLPLGQRSYFRDHDYQGNEVVRMELLDSTVITANGQVHYFRPAWPVEGVGDCSQTMAANNPYYSGNYQYAMDSLLERNDTIFYSGWGSSLPFYFLPRASEGQSWTITSDYWLNDYQEITITCSSVALENYLGITDSVRTFSMSANGSIPGQIPVSDFTIRLSRTHGLIEFVPFSYFLVHPDNTNFRSLELIGFETDGTAHGFQPPVFPEFFHPQQGDVLQWEEHFEPGAIIPPPWTHHHTDTITQVESTANGFTVHYNRFTVHEDQSTAWFPDQTRQINPLGFEALVECPPNWIAGANNEFAMPEFEDRVMLWASNDLIIRMVGTDTIIEYSFGSDEHQVDTSSCSIHEITDMWHEFTIDTQFGLIQSCYQMNVATYCMTLIPETSIVLGSNDRSAPIHSGMILYPDPATDQLFIRGISTANAVYELQDPRGMLVEQGRLQNGMLTVSDLQQGMYVLRLRTSEGVRCGKFIKH